MAQSSETRVRLVIYDFDQTITCDHLYHCLDGGQLPELAKMSDGQLLEIFGGSDRVVRLKKHFAHVTSRATVSIISYGYVAVIRKALERMGMGQYWKEAQVFGTDSQELRQVQGTKHKIVTQLRREMSLKPTETIFIDDDMRTVRSAENANTAIVMKIPDRFGMTEANMKEIEQLVGAAAAQETITITSPKTTMQEGSGRYVKKPEPEAKDQGSSAGAALVEALELNGAPEEEEQEQDQEQGDKPAESGGLSSSSGKSDWKQKFKVEVPEELERQWTAEREKGQYSPVINVPQDSPHSESSEMVPIGIPDIPSDT